MGYDDEYKEMEQEIIAMQTTDDLLFEVESRMAKLESTNERLLTENAELEKLVEKLFDVYGLALAYPDTKFDTLLDTDEERELCKEIYGLWMKREDRCTCGKMRAESWMHADDCPRHEIKLPF